MTSQPTTPNSPTSPLLDTIMECDEDSLDHLVTDEDTTRVDGIPGGRSEEGDLDEQKEDRRMGAERGGSEEKEDEQEREGEEAEEENDIHEDVEEEDAVEEHFDDEFHTYFDPSRKIAIPEITITSPSPEHDESEIVRDWCVENKEISLLMPDLGYQGGVEVEPEQRCLRVPYKDSCTTRLAVSAGVITFEEATHYHGDWRVSMREKMRIRELRESAR